MTAVPAVTHLPGPVTDPALETGTEPGPAPPAPTAKEAIMPDVRILPNHLRVGDVITSDPRRDFAVAELAIDSFGDVTINPGTPDKAFIHADQTVTIRPRA